MHANTPFIRFRFNPEKALHTIIFLAKKEPDLSISIPKLMAVQWLADISHLNDYARPVNGGRWIADDVSPLHKNLYGLLLRDPWISHDTSNDNLNDWPFKLNGNKAEAFDSSTVNLELFSPSDIDSLEEALSKLKDDKQSFYKTSYPELCNHKAYHFARRRSSLDINYIDMLDASDNDYNKKIKYLCEISYFADSIVF